MKTSIKTDKRLKHYALTASAFLTAGISAASVIYTDVDPDNVISGEGAEMFVDINGDGSDDFSFMIYSFSGTVVYSSLTFTYGVKLGVVNALGDNQIFGTLQEVSGYSLNYIPQLPDGSMIGSDDEFISGYGTLALSVSVFGFPYYNYGIWSEASMAYMGIRLAADGDNYYYGWMRLSVSEAGDMITLHDYAYQDNLNQSIAAGQAVAVEEPAELKGVTVYSYNSDIHIQLSGVTDKVDFRLFDLNGRVVLNQGITSSQTIACKQLPAGSYVAELTNASGKISKQLFIGE